jgi:hypothetical protein
MMSSARVCYPHRAEKIGEHADNLGQNMQVSVGVDISTTAFASPMLLPHPFNQEPKSHVKFAV